MEWRILVEYEKVIIPSIEEERTLLIYMKNLKINMVKRIKSIFCFTVSCRRLSSTHHVRRHNCYMKQRADRFICHGVTPRYFLRSQAKVFSKKVFSKKPFSQFSQEAIKTTVQLFFFLGPHGHQYSKS